MSSENIGDNWDPTSHTLLSQANLEGFIFGYLTRAPMRPDNPEQLVWELAEGMRLIDTHTLEITLRRGVRFHDGKPFTAADVKATFEYASQPTRPAQWYPGPCEVAIVNDYACLVQTGKSGFPASLLYLLTSFLPILSASDIADGQVLNQRPNGTGAFRFVEHRGSSTLLAANADYFAGVPEIARIEFTHVGDGSERALALMSGDADIIERLETDQVEALKRNRKLRIHRVVSVENKYLFFRCCKPPFDDVRLRLAACHAIDRRVVLDIVGEAAHASSAHISPVKFGYIRVPNYPEYDPDACQILLAVAGFPRGRGLSEIEFITSRGFYPKSEAYCEAIATMLQAQGFPARLRVLDVATWNELLWHKAGSCSQGHIIDAGWASGSPEPDIVLRTLFHSATSRISGVADREIDAALDKERNAATVDERRKILQSETLPLLARKVPAYSLFTSVLNFAMNKNLQGLYIFPNGMIDASRAAWL
jgi:peptide/nickel transport system substrate-binding protein